MPQPSLSPEVTLIVAATRRMGIGLRGTLPWSGLRREMQYFARVTSRPPPHAPEDTTNAVIIGRHTWESIPERFRPLKKRLNIVVSRSAAPGARAAASLGEALQQAQSERAPRVFVIGGAQLYESALASPNTRRVLLTRIERDFECDTFFPLELGEGGAEGWRRCGREELEAWTGEVVVEGGEEEAGVRYGYEMWERVDDDLETSA